MNDAENTSFQQLVAQSTGIKQLQSCALETIQVNLGLRCNLSCQHCHVGASPRRQEQMSWSTMQHVLDLVERSGCQMVDLTGGAPELNPHFCRFVIRLRQKQVKVQVRTNLTVLLEEEMANMATFFRDHDLALVASMPCYLKENVDSQRGKGIYDKAIIALQKLNKLGYGKQADRILNLVYNPGGAKLPPHQAVLEADYRRELRQKYGIEFSHLLTITNMPIGRFQTDLRRNGEELDYWALLTESFNSATLESLMCRHQVSVRWDGMLYDCDFNLALDMPLSLESSNDIQDCEPTKLAQRTIVTNNHCLGCTAGHGSSCGGALAA